jgi:hypothetical protein
VVEKAKTRATHPPPATDTREEQGNVTAYITDINTWRWPDVRRDAVERFGGELPGATLAAEVVDVFERSPRRVVEEIDAVARDLAFGRIRSGWAVLRRRVEDAGPVHDVVAGDESEKQRRVARALRWITNVGLSCNRLEDVEGELFGTSPPGRCRRTRATGAARIGRAALAGGAAPGRAGRGRERAVPGGGGGAARRPPAAARAGRDGGP